MINYLPYRLLFLLPVVLLFSSCEKEEEFIFPEPGITVENYEGALLLQEPGANIGLTVVARGSAGLTEFRVFLNSELYETIQSGGVRTFTYNFEFTIPQNAPDGENYRFTFESTDEQGRIASSVPVRIRAGNPFAVSDTTISGTDFRRITGRINENLTLTTGFNWLIDSVVSVENESTLTIEAGVTVYFNPNPDPNYVSRLVITREASISAQGTAENPIVFTSANVLIGTPQQQDWGGLFIYGNAPTNQGAVDLEDGFQFGGNAINDDSGTLSFVRIEYTGKGEKHALHLFGVGSGTQIDHVQVWESYNIAFRLKGGAVDLKYIAGINHGAYGIWAEHGWQGRGQFWIFQTEIVNTLIPINYWNQARSIEMRNDEVQFALAPRTDFQISNVTLIGNGWEPEGTWGTRRGLRVRRGAIGEIHNAIVTGFPDDAVRVEDLDIATELGTSMILDNARVWGNRVNWGQEAESFFFGSGNYNLTEEPVPGITLSNFVGSISSPFNPSSLGGWFTPAPYIGAVESESNDWTSEGNWFKDINGNVR